MKIEYIEKILEEIAPLSLAEDWDNSGWQVRFSAETEKILLCLDVTEDVIRQAEAHGVNLIISHHPLLFHPLSVLTEEDSTSALLMEAIKNGIGIYAAHTCFDIADGGMNDFFGEVLGVRDIARLSDKEPYCRIGILEGKPSLPALADVVAQRLGIARAAIRTVFPSHKHALRAMRCIAWCTGSGIDFLEKVSKAGADCFITGDVRHHDALRALSLGLPVIDATHFGTEHIFVAAMKRALCRLGIDANALLSAEEQMPFVFCGDASGI